MAIDRGTEHGESDVVIPRSAYKVWLCGECDSHTEDKDNGDHLCETCGALYDYAGHPLSLSEYRSECLSPDVQEWLSRRL